jgi:cytochrome c oxidase subunit 5b
MEYVGPEDSHDHHHDIHDSSDGAHNYEAEPQTMADFIRPEYR